MVPGLLAGCAAPVSRIRPDAAEWQDWPLERRIAQLLMLGFPGETMAPESPIAVAIRDYGIGGVVLFDNNVDLGVTDRNITGPAQLKALTGSLRTVAATPLFIAVDQEGGVVARLKDRNGFPSTVSARYLGEKNDPALTRSRADGIAGTLKEYGFNLNLAPVVDLNRNPQNPVISLKERSFSGDPAAVSAHAAVFVESHRSRGIATCLKHFPGHGSSREDSHLGLVDVTRYWTGDELIPYRSLIGQGLCDMVMTAHTFNSRLDPLYPATMSKSTIDGILRRELGFDGVVVSDDLAMGAIAQNFSYETAMEKAVNAGVDMLVVANDKHFSADVAPRTVEMLLRMVDDGRIDRQRIDQACGRVMALKGRYRCG